MNEEKAAVLSVREQLPESLSVGASEFRVKRLLGKGKGGYSYLVTDGTTEYVVKQIHHEPCSYYSFGNKLESELRDYARLQAIGLPLPLLLDVDPEKERILKEYIDGPTVDVLIAKGYPMDRLLDQVRAMCSVLYPAGLNIDYYPTNFCLCGDRLYYVDYECNEYDPKWNFENWGILYWTQK